MSRTEEIKKQAVLGALVRGAKWGLMGLGLGAVARAAGGTGGTKPKTETSKKDSYPGSKPFAAPSEVTPGSRKGLKGGKPAKGSPSSSSKPAKDSPAPPPKPYSGYWPSTYKPSSSQPKNKLMKRGSEMNKEASGIEKLAKVLANSDINYEDGTISLKKEALGGMLGPALGALWGAKQAPRDDAAAQVRGALGGGVGTMAGEVVGGVGGALGGGALGALGGAGLGALAAVLAGQPSKADDLAAMLLAGAVPGAAAGAMPGAVLGGLAGDVYGGMRGAQMGTQFALDDQMKQASAKSIPISSLVKVAIDAESLTGGLAQLEKDAPGPEVGLKALLDGAMGNAEEPTPKVASRKRSPAAERAMKYLQK